MKNCKKSFNFEGSKQFSQHRNIQKYSTSQVKKTISCKINNFIILFLSTDCLGSDKSSASFFKIRTRHKRGDLNANQQRFLWPTGKWECMILTFLGSKIATNHVTVLKLYSTEEMEHHRNLMEDNKQWKNVSLKNSMFHCAVDMLRSWSRKELEQRESSELCNTA